MPKIKELSSHYGFKILEDASHAVGAKILSSHIGECKYSDITVFSFHPVKIITTAEGGAALTQSQEIADKLQIYRSHGITKDETKFLNVSNGPWYYEQMELGFNYRLTDIQAALGISQLSRIEEFVEKRKSIACWYDTKLKNKKIKRPVFINGFESSWHLYVIQLTDEYIKYHKKLFVSLQQNGLGVQLHYIPVHLQPFYRKFGFKEGDYPVSEKYAKRAISIPIYPNLTKAEQKLVVDKINMSLKDL